MPADQSDLHEDRVDIGSFFGYTHLLCRPRYVAMVGDGRRLQVGALVRLKADSQGYMRCFRDGDTVVIVGFRRPHTDGCTDYVILATDGREIGEVKPQRIEAILHPGPRELAE